MTEVEPSWGRFPKSSPRFVHTPEHADHLLELLRSTQDSVLARGLGRSYGDSCLNNNGTLLRMHRMRRIFWFDHKQGRIHVESGISLGELLNAVIPDGWFLPVVPGTRHVTVGGAIANDIHGKNHHIVGTFGCHVESFTLAREGEVHTCSASENPNLFAATIGGLGLTGVIISATIRLRRINSTNICVHKVKARSVSDMISMMKDADAEYEYSVAWLDAHSENGYCLFGNHASDGPLRRMNNRTVPVPTLAKILLRRPTVRLFNWMTNAIQPRLRDYVVHAEPFFFPLDAVSEWSRLYGSRGFIQYQFVVPFESGPAIVEEIFTRLRSARLYAYLTVLKLFGSAKSPGMLSFPIPGITVAMDFPNTSPALFATLNQCDALVASGGGRVYPAKDARMTGNTFRQMYANELDHFRMWIDQQCMSSFWNRVMAEEHQ